MTLAGWVSDLVDEGGLWLCGCLEAGVKELVFPMYSFIGAGAFGQVGSWIGRGEGGGGRQNNGDASEWEGKGVSAPKGVSKLWCASLQECGWWSAIYLFCTSWPFFSFWLRYMMLGSCGLLCFLPNCR